MAEQLLSTDPAAGRLLSQDPRADAASVLPRDARGLPQVASVTEEGPGSPLLQQLGPLAHPETLTDFARLLTLPVDTVKKAFAGALTLAAARPAASATAQALRSAPGAAARGVVNGTAAVGDVVDPGVIGALSPRTGKLVELAQRIRAARAAAAPTITPAVADTAAVVEPAAAAPIVDEFTAARTARQAAPGGLPDQRALNEAALAARRAAYQASQRGAAPIAAEAAPVTEAAAIPPPVGPVVKASGKMQLTAPEMKEFSRLLARKIPPADALAAVRQMRELAARLGGASPSEVAKAVAQREATGKW